MKKLENELEEYQILADGFDDETITQGCKKTLESINLEFSCIRQLWNHIKFTQDKFQEIYKFKFKDTNLDDLEDLIRDLTKKFQQIKNIKTTEVAKTFRTKINQWPSFINNLRGLKETYFKDRHWKMICEEVKANDFKFSDPNMILKQVWDLSLETSQEAVEDIFERSKQEYKMAAKLEEFEKLYKDIEFE